MNLPDGFKQSMKALMQDEAFELFESLDEKPYSALRVNTSKISADEFEKIAPFEIEKIPFTENGYYINGVKTKQQPYKIRRTHCKDKLHYGKTALYFR